MRPWGAQCKGFRKTYLVGARLGSQDIAVPKHTALYKYRVDLDLATIFFARKRHFGLSTSWYAHVRLDSSPQYGRDYLLSECDLFYPTNVQSWDDVSREGVLKSRLLVGQMVGARAAGVIVKTKKLLHALELDIGQCFKSSVFIFFGNT